MLTREPDTWELRQFGPKTLQHWFGGPELSGHLALVSRCPKDSSDLSAELSCHMYRSVLPYFSSKLCLPLSNNCVQRTLSV